MNIQGQFDAKDDESYGGRRWNIYDRVLRISPSISATNSIIQGFVIHPSLLPIGRSELVGTRLVRDCTISTSTSAARDR